MSRPLAALTWVGLTGLGLLVMLPTAPLPALVVGSPPGHQTSSRLRDRERQLVLGIVGQFRDRKKVPIG